MRSSRIHLLIALAAACWVSFGSWSVQESFAQSTDEVLRELLEQNGVEPFDPGGGHTEERIALGQALFFDRELSGNRDTSCATCHHPTLSTGDGLALPVGTAPVQGCRPIDGARRFDG